MVKFWNLREAALTRFFFFFVSVSQEHLRTSLGFNYRLRRLVPREQQQMENRDDYRTFGLISICEGKGKSVLIPDFNFHLDPETIHG